MSMTLASRFHLVWVFSRINHCGDIPMYRLLRAVIVLACIAGQALPLTAGEQADRFKKDAERLHKAIMNDNELWPLMAEFCDMYPKRLGGSENLERGLDWIIDRMTKEGWKVRTQHTMVPNWKRGPESLVMNAPIKRSMPVLGLGGNVGTNGKPLTAKVLVVKSFDELKRRQAEAKGRIVVWNVEFTTYGPTVAYRYNGASEAARYGAVASLVRSVGPYGIQTPHTGGMGYNDSLPKIASAAITIEDALLLQRMQDRGQETELTLTMEAHWEPDAPSRNVIIEIPGRELPNEVVVMGGHIDSWDVGTGAMDDAGGCFITWRALVHMRNLGFVPKRTIRVCFWTNEENGLRGGITYADSTKNEKHFMAMESDGGTFKPVGFSLSAQGELRKKLEDVSSLLDVVGASSLRDGNGGADTSPLHARGVEVMELVTEGNYFWYHHTDGDTPDKLVPREMQECAYSMAVMAWACANM
jgi:carboxypeptidase Q